MTAVLVPVFRFAVSYSVNFGRRWTALEQMILLELITNGRSAETLSQMTGMPVRLIIEALINLLRVGWVDIRMTSAGAYFQATISGKRRAADPLLPSVQTRKLNWTSMCLDRLTGGWLRADDLMDLIYESDAPTTGQVLPPILNTFEIEDGVLRSLVYVGRDETFESFEPNLRAPSLMYAKVGFEFGEPVLPEYAPLRLREAIRNSVPESSRTTAEPSLRAQSERKASSYDSLAPTDFIVGGPEHKAILLEALERASTFVVIHSCLLSDLTVKDLLASLISAAQRGVRIELLWGHHSDPDDYERRGRVAAVRSLLESIPPPAQALIQLSPISSDHMQK